jgi:acetyltransferase
MNSNDAIFGDLQNPSIALMGMMEGGAHQAPLPTESMRDAIKTMFKPRSIALIGASEAPNSIGCALAKNLSKFSGRLYYINPNRATVFNKKTVPQVSDIAGGVDLALIATPEATLASIMQACAVARVRTAVIFSSIYAQTPNQAVAMWQSAARPSMLPRIIGPNSLGVMNTKFGLNATFAERMALPGNVAFISQSNAISTAVLDWSFRENVGFSHFISLGNMADVSWSPLIDYLGDDQNTDSIVIYLETIGNEQNSTRNFISAARETSLSKPIIVLKAGRTQAALQAAASHTGSLTDSDDALDAVFNRCGVLRVNTIADMFYMAEVLAKQPRPKGPRLSIVTNAGGPGVLATDTLISHGGQLAPIDAALTSALNNALSSKWSQSNPIDIFGDATPERYAKAIELSANNPESDGLLVILSPQGGIDVAKAAETLLPYAKTGKPILASWMGGDGVAEGEAILNRARIPTFGYPDTAARVFTLMWQYTNNLRGLYETPEDISANVSALEDLGAEPAQSLSTTMRNIVIGDSTIANNIIEAARGQGRNLLTEHESKQILMAYGIKTVETFVATTEDEAVQFAQQIGYPVVLKLHSYHITHKNDIGGVELNLRSDEGVRKAYRAIQSAVLTYANTQPNTDEKLVSHVQWFAGVTVQAMIPRRGYDLILGCSTDPHVGPLILFGTGGQLVEVLKDRALGLPPLNSTLARRLMEQTRIYSALRGAPSARGRKSVDLDALASVLVRFSHLVTEQRWIKEIDINPLLVTPLSDTGLKGDEIIALDARMVLHDQRMRMTELPRLAIRPYPVRYVKTWAMRDGTVLIIRPIRAEDESRIVDFHKTVSNDSVYLRYFLHYPLEERIRHERLTRVCFVDYDREIALVAVRPDSGAIIGVGRLVKVNPSIETGGDAEFYILLSDTVQRQGLGGELLRRLVEIGRDWGCGRVVADILPDNYGMIMLSRKLGFTVRYDFDKAIMRAEISCIE